MVISLLICLSCSAPKDHSKDEANIRLAYESLSKRDFVTFASLCSDDFMELGLASQPIKGVQASIEQYKTFLNAFPDLKLEIMDIAPAGKNKYFLRVHLTGSNTANFLMLPPTSKHADVIDVDIIEVNEAGKCSSHWSANSDGMLDAIGYGSITNPSTGLAMAAYEAFGKKDIPGILNLCNDDVVFEIHDDILNPNEIHLYKGKTEVGKFFAELASKITYSVFQPTRFLADGDDVVVFVNTEFKQNSSSQNYKANYYHYFKSSNGKVSYFKGVLDTPKKI